MPRVEWSSLIADEAGRIEHKKIMSLVSILLALAGGVVVVVVMTGILKPQSDAVMIGVGTLVLPLTGGKIAGGIAGAISRRLGGAPEPPKP